MKRFLGAAVLCGVLLTGCANPALLSEHTEEPPAATVSPDGDPGTVTCHGSYTGSGSMDTVIARLGDSVLTNEELQVWYWAEVTQYRRGGSSPAPDFSLPLDVQTCPVDSSVNNWQQYFLKTALNRWHTAQALIRHSQETPIPLEEAYKPNQALHKYMDQMPVKEILYGYNEYYSPNSLHQQYLDFLPETLTGPVLEAAQDLNYGYMYFTSLTYGLEAEEPAPVESAQPLVSFRHILLLPQEDGSMNSRVEEAVTLLETWMQDRDAGADTFAQLASQHSQDLGSVKSGGLYRNLRRDQLPEALGQWCFDEARQEGDTCVLPMDYGVHILYFLNREDSALLEARQSSRSQVQLQLLQQIREAYPAQMDYGSMVLAEETSDVSLSDLLYPDISHERFPEVPVYLQQNYQGTMYGDYQLSTNGCGITSLAMLATYMADDELTPPELCERFGRYSRPTGSAGSLFEEVPPQLGFYLIEKLHDWRIAREYMKEGHPVVVCQHKGYWTRGGHYLVLEELTEDGDVRVRDSNMFNYRKLRRHQDDHFPWDTICGAGSGYWVFEKKVTSTPACTRCGDPEALDVSVVTDYLCDTCRTALIRRNSYLCCP